MKQLLLALGIILAGFAFLITAPGVRAQASNCCPSWAGMGSSCTTLSGSYGKCQTSGNIEPYLSECSNASPPVLSCIVQCSGVYCDSGSTAGSICTTANGNTGTCTNVPHTEPYLSQCPNTNGSLACLTAPPLPGCCLVSNQGQSCLINSTTVGTCRTPTASEAVNCPYWNICATPTGSGSYTCECTKTSFGFNCQPSATNTCQSGNRPNITQCSPLNTTNPCGSSDTFSSCQLPCVPGGYMDWGEYGCKPPNPNAIPPISPSQLCLPGLVCQYGFCMKPNGSVNFSEACIWDSECSTCQTGNSCPVQMKCAKYIVGEQVGMCDGQCGGQGASDCVEIFCNNQVGTVNTAIGCIPSSNPESLIAQISKWSIGIAAGAALITIAYSGFLITTARGDIKKVSSAKTFLLSALSGLVVIALSLLILNFIGVRLLGLGPLGFSL